MTETYPTLDQALAVVDAAIVEVNFDVMALPEPVRVLYLISSTDFEITQGGVRTWLVNSSGTYAAESVAAYEAVGAMKSADILRRALDYFPGGVPPKDELERAARVRRLMDIAYLTWDELGGALLAYPDELDVLLAAYVRDHAPAFRPRDNLRVL